MKKSCFFLLAFIFSATYSHAQSLISQGKESWASSSEFAAAGGNDGDSGTRWSSNHISDINPDDAWWAVDLGSEYHISKVEIEWEAAYATEYKIELSNSEDFSSVTEIAHIINGSGGEETVNTDINHKGRYLRFKGVKRALQYGYSFWEFRVYGITTLSSTQVQIIMPYVQYLKLAVNPADLNGVNEITVQNKEEIVNLTYNVGSPINISLLDFRGNFDVDLWSYQQGSTSEVVRGIPFSYQVYNDMMINVELTPRVSTGNLPPVADVGRDITIYAPSNSTSLNGSKSQDKDGEIVSYSWQQLSGPADANIATPSAATTNVSNLNQLGDYKFQLTVTDNEGATGTSLIIVSVLPPEQIDFSLLTPTNQSMVTDNRRPQLTWESFAGATKYEVFMNITRDDYEWYASGNLLDRYTKIGESATNSFTLTQDLVDRWTYRWYVIATTSSGKKYSNKHEFGLYIPYLEQENDGVQIVNGCRDLNKNGTIEPFENWKLTPQERLDDLMSRLTDEEKVSQLFYGANENPKEGFAFSYGVEGGMRTVQYAAANSRMGIPVAFLGDKMHGWKTIYPTQLGLAATRDMNLAYECGNMHRIEQKSFGFTGTLAPLAEVATKVLYPRVQEGAGENADEVAAMVRAMVCGMQGGPEINPHSMLVTVKHWPSQGAGGEGPTQYDEVTIKYHMKPWYAAVEANAASVMPGYSSSPFLDPSGLGANSSKKIIDYLRNVINFQGFIVTDWLAANTEQSIESIGAGIDVLGGAPFHKYENGNFIEPYTNMSELINAVGWDRINEAVRRVLDTKIRLGMFENPYSDPTCTWTNEENHAIALNAARKSITMLKNQDHILPLSLNSNEQIVVGGERATWPSQNDDPNVIWQSIYYDNPKTKNFLQAIQDRASSEGIQVFKDNSTNPKVAVVVIGENSYTHGTDWENKNPNIPESQLAVIRDFKNAGVKVVSVVILPRPYVLTPVVEYSDAVLAIYRGGNGIAQAVAECIFGDFNPTGKLPFQLPRSQEQVGTDDINNQIERWELPYDIGASEHERQLIRNLIDQDLPVPAVYGNPLFQYGFGLQYYTEPNTPVSIEEDKTIKTKKLVVFPTIFENGFNVKFENPEEVKLIEVIDITGKVIFQEMNISENFYVNLSDKSSGVYILRIVDANKVFIKKVIKKN